MKCMMEYDFFPRIERTQWFSKPFTEASLLKLHTLKVRSLTAAKKKHNAVSKNLCHTFAKLDQPMK